MCFTPKVKLDGFTFDSEAEAEYYKLLLEREKLLSEIGQARHIGHWKHANDLKKHYDKLIKERKI